MRRALGSKGAGCLRLPGRACTEGAAHGCHFSHVSRGRAFEDPELFCLPGSSQKAPTQGNVTSQQAAPQWATKSQVAFGVEGTAQISSVKVRQFEGPFPCFLAELLRTSLFPIWGMGRESPWGRSGGVASSR